jgi:hypothetical protein
LLEDPELEAGESAAWLPPGNGNAPVAGVVVIAPLGEVAGAVGPPDTTVGASGAAGAAEEPEETAAGGTDCTAGTGGTEAPGTAVGATSGATLPPEAGVGGGAELPRLAFACVFTHNVRLTTLRPTRCRRVTRTPPTHDGRSSVLGGGLIGRA